MNFADAFSFTRPIAAPYLDAGGNPQTAPAGTPRFDHNPDGSVRGLLVEGAPERAAADQVQLLPDILPDPSGFGTLVHEYETPAGEIVRRACYSRRPHDGVAALLGVKGWHRYIAFVPRVLPNVGGAVTLNGRSYDLPGQLLVEGADVLSTDGDSTAIITG